MAMIAATGPSAWAVVRTASNPAGFTRAAFRDADTVTALLTFGAGRHTVVGEWTAAFTGRAGEAFAAAAFGTFGAGRNTVAFIALLTAGVQVAGRHAHLAVTASTVELVAGVAAGPVFMAGHATALAGVNADPSSFVARFTWSTGAAGPVIADFAGVGTGALALADIFAAKNADAARGTGIAAVTCCWIAGLAGGPAFGRAAAALQPSTITFLAETAGAFTAIRACVAAFALAIAGGDTGAVATHVGSAVFAGFSTKTETESGERVAAQTIERALWAAQSENAFATTPTVCIG